MATLPSGARKRGWLWATLGLSSLTIVTAVFAVWELIEYRLFRTIDYQTLHFLYITRGVISSLLLACWAAWFVLRHRRQSEAELRRSQERYRGLLEASPGAVALYDRSLKVAEWNAAAERLYGYGKAEVLGRPLPTAPPELADEMRAFLARVEQGESVLEVETRRLNRDGVPVEVQLSLLPYREEPGQSYFLEVTEDIRARVRLRENLLEIEKLTTIGRMAAGTAHHLNTPLATMLLRVQMMRNRSRPAPAAADLDILESGLRFCGYFVERLRTFSRPPPLVKRPEEVRHTIQSVVDFFSPSLMVRHAGIVLDVAGADGLKVEADRNLLEALFLILLSNALDAIEDRGSITVRCRGLSESVVEVQVADQGRGIAPADLPRVFEPFFTTKGPGKGTGLGLAIARNIVLAHGGSIRLDSAPERGTTVSVELPVYREQAGGTPA